MNTLDQDVQEELDQLDEYFKIWYPANNLSKIIMNEKASKLTDAECTEIATILSRRANEIAGYVSDYGCEGYPKKEPNEFSMPASVEYACTLEIKRLRDLEAKIRPVAPVQEEED